MRKFTGIVAALLLALCVLAGCGSGTGGSSKQTATNDVDFNGTSVIVSIDVSDGWSVEFTAEGTVYLFDGEYSDDAIQIANGFLITQEEYESELASYQDSDDSFSEVGGGFIAEDGSRYLFYVGGDVFYKIQVDTYDHPDANCDEIFSRFNVHLED